MNPGRTSRCLSLYQYIVVILVTALIPALVNAEDCSKAKSSGDAVKCLQNTITDLKNQLSQEISSRIIVPKNAVMAFELSSCPTGWSAYAPAFGRFVRGIDIPGTTDPQGTRAPGNLQEDSLQQHSHDMESAKSAAHSPGSQAPHGYDSGGYGHNISATQGIRSESKSSNETRPKNVSLLYCIKN